MNCGGTWPTAHLDDSGQPQLPLDFDTLRGTGLLWKINHDLLHPLGLALGAADCEGFDHPDQRGIALTVVVATDGEWEFSPPELNDEYRTRFNQWYQAIRASLMDEVGS